MDTHNPSSSQTKFQAPLSVVLVIIVIALAVGGSYYSLSKRNTSQSSVAMPGEGEGSLPSLSFAGKKYDRVSTLPSDGVDLTSESYEWAPRGESSAAWTSLITTHKMAPKDTSKPISAKVYAENAATMNEKQGAIIIETSIINTPDAIKEAGIDPNNPPYLLVYAYPASTSTPVEVDIQKVVNGPDGTVEAFIYAFPFSAKSEQEVTAFFQSKAFTDKRADVIKAIFPY